MPSKEARDTRLAGASRSSRGSSNSLFDVGRRVRLLRAPLCLRKERCARAFKPRSQEVNDMVLFSHGRAVCKTRSRRADRTPGRCLAGEVDAGGETLPAVFL